MERPTRKIAKYRDFLKERIDTDKILDCLLAKALLSKEEVDEVKSRSTICQKNEKLLEYIIKNEKDEEFISALADANQQHLANYLLTDGVRNKNVWDDWPLTPTRIQILDVNYGSLKDLIEIEGGLADKLFAKRVISHRHKQLICSKATDSEKNEAFLDILRRGSMRDYENTIQCLHDSNQEHIAEILDKGGVAVPVHAELEEPMAEVRIAERIKDMLRDRTVEESKRILEMASLKVIAAKHGHSISFYFYCKSSKSWQELKKHIKCGSLKVILENLCKRFDSQTNVVIKKIQISDRDQENLDKYFANKGNRIWIKRVLPITLAIAFLCISIVLGFAERYGKKTVPCWTKELECREALTKMGALHGLHERLTMNFKQLQNVTSELLQTVKESPDNDDLISLILKMYEIPNEEARQKITERIQQLRRILTEKTSYSAKRKKAIINTMESVMDLIGKASLIMTLDVIHLAENLLKLVNDTLTRTEDTEEPDTEEESPPTVHGGLMKVFIQWTFQYTIWFRPLSGRKSYPQLPGPSQAEIYEKALTEKLTAVEKWMQVTVMVIVELIRETEGVNHLLRKILDKFQDDSKDVCEHTPDIKESKTRGFRELHSGMLRLTCLLDETARMARLVTELSIQAISLKQDVDRMAEEVNEFVKQSIPSLLITLLTVTKHEMSNKQTKPR